jgi:DNA mismatch endonuclease (patch repair protein)
MDELRRGGCIALQMDTRSPEQRSRIMRSVRSRNTGPELIVRRMLHSLGLRFRLHRRDLAGRPDIVLPGRNAVVFVHGCFWHGHECSKGKLPKSRIGFWTDKIERNRKRDAESVRSLRSDGWRVLTVWQCEIKDASKLRARLGRFFAKPTNTIRKRRI